MDKDFERRDRIVAEHPGTSAAFGFAGDLRRAGEAVTLGSTALSPFPDRLTVGQRPLEP